MKIKIGHFVFMALVFLLSILICYKYQVSIVLAKEQHNPINISDTVSKLVNPASLLRDSSPVTSPYIPSNGTPLLKTWQWPDDGVTDPNKMTNEFALEPDPNWPADPSTGKPQGLIAHVKTAKQFLQAVYGYYQVKSDGVTPIDHNASYDEIPYKNVADGMYNTGRYTNITKIVLEENIDIPSFSKEDNIKIKAPDGRLVPVNFASSLTYIVDGNTNGAGGYKYLTTTRRPSQKDETDINNTHTFSHLVIDGTSAENGRHSLNMGNLTLQTYSNSNQDITFENIDTYGSCYYGLIDAYDGGTSNFARQTYRNMNYYGSQFSFGEGSSTFVMIDGKVNAYSLVDYNYDSPVVGVGKIKYRCQTNAGGGDQQNIQAKEVTFEPDSQYNGYTFSGNTIELTGNANIEKNAIVNLFPHRDIYTTPEDSPTSYISAGLYLKGGTAKVNMKKDSKLNIICDKLPLSARRTIDNSVTNFHYNVPQMPVGTTNTDGNYSASAIGLFMAGTNQNSGIYYDKESNASIYINSTVALPTNINLVTVNGGTADIGGGAMYIKAENLGSNNANVLGIGSGAQVQIDRGGTFDLSAPGATGNVNMLTTSGTGQFNVYVYKPKLLKIETPHNNPNAYLVNGTGRVEMHGVKASAIGHKINTPGSDDPDVELKETPFEYLNLPFNGNFLQTAIPPYTNADVQMGVQSNGASLLALKDVITPMLGDYVIGPVRKIREFDSITVRAIDDGPKITDTTPQINKISEITPTQRKITGVVTDTAGKDITTGLAPYQSNDKVLPRLRLVLNRLDASGKVKTIDLGTKTNDKKDIGDPLTKALDSNVINHPIQPDAWDWEYSKDANGNTVPKEVKYLSDKGIPAYTVSGTSTYTDTPWEYINYGDKDDDNIPDSQKCVTWNGNQFTIDVDKVIKEYNNKNLANPIQLTGSDTINVLAEHAFQASQVIPIKVTTLNLKLGNKYKTYYAKGSDLQLPVQYQENHPDAKKLILTGWYLGSPNITDALDPNAPTIKSHTPTAAVPNPGFDIGLTQPAIPASGTNPGQAAEWKDVQWSIVNSPTVPVTSNLGKHAFKFYGSDNQNGRSPDFNLNSAGKIDNNELLEYDYEVLNLPSYSGKKELWGQKLRYSNDPSFVKPNPDRIGTDIYTEKNIFTPQANTMEIGNNVTFTRGDSATGDNDSPEIDVKDSVTIIATINGKKYSFATKWNNSHQVTVKPSDFKLTTDNFPVNTIFELDNKVRLLTATKDLLLASTHMQTNYKHTVNGQDQIDLVNLGESKTIKIGNPYKIVLTVPNKIDFGNHTVSKIEDKDYQITNDKDVKDNLRLEYTPVSHNSLAVYAILDDYLTGTLDNTNQLSDPDEGLYYKSISGNKSYLSQATQIGDVINVGTLPASGPATTDKTVMIANDWWNKGIQTIGLFLHINQHNNYKVQEYKSTITWSVDNSIQ
ncbi:pectate lyase-like adhesive domain-containing protein [Bombilactobacillus bombi]|uniref:pectate lyase-like adhesive domain-containing protein n=1 Tax=Bombilactobacillus bombi TaxID=1303590 RepID=UPI0015E609C3|nr:pectate lyase-like adhesive domain-containing protein [Bombilactobacillus bombi]MBA1434505.1 hypothetical protein [Bombilactobacillus bombi]